VRNTEEHRRKKRKKEKKLPRWSLFLKRRTSHRPSIESIIFLLLLSTRARSRALFQALPLASRPQRSFVPLRRTRLTVAPTTHVGAIAAGERGRD
jgi:hypothetical protein